MLASAFNTILKLRGKQASIKRLGSPNLYSPATIADSNYSRLLSGPENTTIRGNEYVVSAESLLGTHKVTAVLSAVATSGQFKVGVNSFVTGDLDFNISIADLQIAIRALDASLASVVVEGVVATSFSLKFYDVQSAPVVTFVPSTGTPIDSNFTVTGGLFESWSTPIKRGDRVLDGSKVLSILEVVDMTELSGNLIGYRLRCD